MTPQEHFAVAKDAFEQWWADKTSGLDQFPELQGTSKRTHRMAFLTGWSGGLENGMAEGGRIMNEVTDMALHNASGEDETP